jgi:hypothetical protein
VREDRCPALERAADGLQLEAQWPKLLMPWSNAGNFLL